MCAQRSTPFPHLGVFYNNSIFFIWKDVWRISIRSLASSASGATRATDILACSNIQGKNRWLRSIPSNIQGNYHLPAKPGGNGNLAQCSNQPESPWLIPPRKPMMLENERKSVLRLFHWKMICCHEMRKACGSCVEHSPLKKFGSMFDAEAIHAQFPSNIEPNYQIFGQISPNSRKSGRIFGQTSHDPLPKRTKLHIWWKPVVQLSLEK